MPTRPMLSGPLLTGPLLNGPIRYGRSGVVLADADSTRTIGGIVILLVLLGVALIVLAVRLVKATRPEPEVLAPLEVMGERSWRKADQAKRVRMLDGVRPRSEVAPSLAYDVHEQVVDDADWDPDLPAPPSGANDVIVDIDVDVDDFDDFDVDDDADGDFGDFDVDDDVDDADDMAFDSTDRSEHDHDGSVSPDDMWAPPRPRQASGSPASAETVSNPSSGSDSPFAPPRAP